MAVLAVQADAEQAAAGYRLELQELQGQRRRATQQAADSVTIAIQVELI